MQHIKFVYAFANVLKNTFKKIFIKVLEKETFEFHFKINTYF